MILLASFRRLLLGATLVMTTAVGVSQADTKTGLAKFREGEYSEAVIDWRDAAESGDAAAALYLGVLYDTGFGVPQSASEALQWYRRAGERGNVSGMVNTAIMLDAGRGIAAQPEAAVRWYDRAAQAGSGRAAYNLGLMYQDGIGVPRDRAAAIQSFRQAVANGVAEGRAHLRQLGVREASRTGAPRQDEAMKDFEQAQQALLARGPAADARAAELFRKAAEAGNALAAYNLGYCFEHGIGVATSRGEALHWYRKSAAMTSDPTVRSIAAKGEQSLSTNFAVQR